MSVPCPAGLMATRPSTREVQALAIAASRHDLVAFLLSDSKKKKKPKHRQGFPIKTDQQAEPALDRRVTLTCMTDNQTGTSRREVCD